MSTEQIAEAPPWPRGADQGHPDSAAVRSTLTDLEEQARTLIRQRPVVAAVGVGYLVARLVSRVMR